jgi:hypothetical protein
MIFAAAVGKRYVLLSTGSPPIVVSICNLLTSGGLRMKKIVALIACVYLLGSLNQWTVSAKRGGGSQRHANILAVAGPE